MFAAGPASEVPTGGRLMFTCLTLSLALAAPVPAAEAPAPVGPVPRLLDVKASADGKVTVPVTRAAPQGGGVVVVGINGNQNGAQVVVQQDGPKTVALDEVKEL